VDIYSYAPEWREIVNSKLQNFSDINDDFSSIKVVVHNGTWCPDCVRETTDLLAMVESLDNRAPSLEVIAYEDIEDYKVKKSSGTLPIKCLPTMIFYKNGDEIGRIEEKSNPNFKALAVKILSNI
jgi:thiol-disulfide isomerase/thioredoxin